MQTINSASELKKAIQMLEIDRAVQWELLQEQVFTTYETMKPINIIKNSLQDMASSPHIINKLFPSLVGFFSKFITKQTSKSKSDNPIKNVLNSLLQVGITSFILNPIAINVVKGFLMQYFFKKSR
ncbi:MAG: hypothetical protein WC135_01415 [Bacteroidales bacterium]